MSSKRHFARILIWRKNETSLGLGVLPHREHNQLNLNAVGIGLSNLPPVYDLVIMVG